MKIIKFFVKLLAPLALSILLCIVVFKLLGIRPEGIKNEIKRMTKQEYITNMGLYSISQVDKQELRTASYNIDFIASFSGGGTKFIAIYPYLIEAGVDLGKATHEVVNGQTIVTLPNAQITVARINEKNQVQVIREKGNKLDYNTHIKPLKMAFEKSAKDLALQAGILKDANEKAEKYLQELFKGQNYVFQKEAAEYETLQQSYTYYAPLTFNYTNMNFKEGGLYGTPNWDRDFQTLNSPNCILGYSGFVGNMTPNEMEKKNSVGNRFQKYNNYCNNQNEPPVVLKVLNPLDMHYTHTYFNASDGYRTGLVRSNGEMYYLISKTKDSETHSLINAPEMLYLSMMLSSNGYGVYEEYNDWSWNYTKCLQSVRDRRYHETLSLLAKMENTRKYCAKRDSVDASQTFGEFWMQSLAQIMTNNGYKLQYNDDWVFQRLDLLYYMKSGLYKHLTDDAQNRILAGNVGDDDFKLRLKELFYLLPETSLSQREQYAEDLINAAQFYNHNLTNTLSGTHFCKYLATIINRYDNKYKVESKIPENETEKQRKNREDYERRKEYDYQYTLLENYSDFTVMTRRINNDKKYGGYYGVKEILKHCNMLDEKNGQFAILFKEDEGWLRKEIRNILLFDKKGCYVLKNVEYNREIPSVEYIYASTYDNLTSTINTSKNEYSFTVGGSTHKGKGIAFLIKDIRNSMEKERMESAERFVSELEKDHINNILFNYWRP